MILFDILFDGNLPIDTLIDGDDFVDSFNYYPHSLNRDEFINTINVLIENGYLKCRIEDSIRSKRIIITLGMTELGGNLWEKERLPIWDNFIFDLIDHKEDEGIQITLYSPSIDTIRSYIEVSTECNLYELRHIIKIVENKMNGDYFCLIPWKHFTQIYEVVIFMNQRGIKNHQTDVDWQYFAKHKYWWKDVNDLLENL